MEFTKKEAYAIQISCLLADGKLADACTLSEEMIAKYPGEALSHFMASKSCFLSGDYARAASEGKIAYGLSSSREDLLASAVASASALLMLGRADEAKKMLAQLRDDKDAEVKKLQLIISMSEGRPDEAGQRFKELYSLNRSSAGRFIKALAKGRGAGR